jgi:hypothetical protein
MTTTKKPKWVEALEEAEACLKGCGDNMDADKAHALTVRARAWMDISRLYRDSVGA